MNNLYERILVSLTSFAFLSGAGESLSGQGRQHKIKFEELGVSLFIKNMDNLIVEQHGKYDDERTYNVYIEDEKILGIEFHYNSNSEGYLYSQDNGISKIHDSNENYFIPSLGFMSCNIEKSDTFRCLVLTKVALDFLFDSEFDRDSPLAPFMVVSLNKSDMPFLIDLFSSAGDETE